MGGKAVIAALGLALTVSGCGSNSTGLGLNLVPEEQVESMGLDAWQQITAETPRSNNAQYQRIADRVAAQVLNAAGKNPQEWEVVVFEGGEANAFALPGKKIGVFEGMMRTTQNDAQLAAVIAHEIAHVEQDHSQERLNSQAATDLGVNLAGAALGAAGIGNPQAIAGLLGAGAQYGLLLPYSRNQELEADRLGLEYMARAGYDPRAALAFWEQMQAQDGERPPAFLSTHPAPEQRIEQLEAMLPGALEAYRAAGG